MLLLFIILTALSLTACHRKQRLDPLADVPNLPADTIYIAKVVSRCNYQYLSTDPKKAKKQLQYVEKQLDSLILSFDPRITAKGKLASKLLREHGTDVK